SSTSSSISLDTASEPALTFSTISPSSSSRYCASCDLISASSAICGPLNLSYKIQARLECFRTFLPLGWANFAWMLANIVGCFDLVTQRAGVAADAACVDFNCLNNTGRVEDECTAVSQAILFNPHIEVAPHHMGRIADHRVGDFASRFRAVMP